MVLGAFINCWHLCFCGLKEGPTLHHTATILPPHSAPAVQCSILIGSGLLCDCIGTLGDAGGGPRAGPGLVGAPGGGPPPPPIGPCGTLGPGGPGGRGFI